MAEQYIEILDEQEELERVNELNNRELHLQYIICIKMKDILKRNKRNNVTYYETKFQQSQHNQLTKYFNEHYPKDTDANKLKNIPYRAEQVRLFRKICKKNNELIAKFASIIEAIKQQRPKENKIDYTEKIMCKVCNCEISRNNVARHNKSEKHLKKIETEKANKINNKNKNG
jgi:hypothetical protein